MFDALSNIFNKNFSERVKKRRKIFNKSEAEAIKYIVLDEYDNNWKNSKHWQLKLYNKANSRMFAMKYNCKVPELYWQTNQINSSLLEALPDKYVIKPTVGYSAQSVFLMKASINLFDNVSYERKDILSELEKVINTTPSVEFVAEEFIRNENGEYKIPDDYKIYTFNGSIACIQVINRLSPKKGFTTFYDADWKQLDAVNTAYPEGAYQEPPKCLTEMLEQAIILSKAYKIFVRIDFYATDKGAVFGEFTPTPFAGKHFTPFGEKLLTNYWDKYCKGLI